jgi:hypothetical protein
MKKSLYLVLAGFLFFATSCLKEDHTIRFRNNFRESILNVRLGNADIGTVGIGGVSSYKSITTGDFNISGNTSSGGTLSGSGSITGKGKHKWTVTLSSSGSITMEED